ncbi:hypothetical protein [Paenibacillus beijingensis]|uniref:Ferritin-like domain-containing protein n=1 Tax=Paenibacillus beijingensis TaxID=1126833 RepID=A0A0D5NDM7_9BACL|nr:hypothetical protein [Paenibacillus beijingensis]AJY73499.1 hypothetical protein VN24_01245 [Paenibacillus beijingensis]
MTEEQFWTEFNGIKEELMAHSGANAKQFWSREDLTHDEVFEAIIVRDWLEIAYVIFLGTELLNYWREFDRSIVTALCKHMWDEAKHYEMLSNVIEKHGYSVPKTTPETSKEWEELHMKALTMDCACAVAVWNVSETSTTTTMDVLIENCRRIGLDDLARCYEKIKKDEAFHCNLGVTILKKYLTTDERRMNAIWGARQLRDRMFKLYNVIYPVNAVN